MRDYFCFKQKFTISSQIWENNKPHNKNSLVFVNKVNYERKEIIANQVPTKITNQLFSIKKIILSTGSDDNSEYEEEDYKFPLITDEMIFQIYEIREEHLVILSKIISRNENSAT
jgi:hypothetical protein